MALYFLPKPLRQHPKYTFNQAFGIALFKMLWNFASQIEWAPPKSLEPGKDKTFLAIDPAKASLYRSVLDDPTIHPARMGAIWYPRTYDPTTDKDKNVVLHFHGGAYVLGGCRPMEGGEGPALLANHISGLTFSAQYRLASHPNSRFPAALQDAVTSYNYLLELGIPASQIILSGDSAGGNLAVTLLRYIEDQKELLPRPLACFLWSPWVDLAVGPVAAATHRNYKFDYIPSLLVGWGECAYKSDSIEATHPYISPLNNAFSTSIPILVHSGTLEVLHDGHIAFVNQMKKIPGNEIVLVETVDAPHDIFAAGQITGFMKEAEAAMDDANEFLKRKTK
jgi:acetyl esterase/lipase